LNWLELKGYSTVPCKTQSSLLGKNPKLCLVKTKQRRACCLSLMNFCSFVWPAPHNLWATFDILVCTSLDVTPSFSPSTASLTACLL
jgi:hypothetical protein